MDCVKYCRTAPHFRLLVISKIIIKINYKKKTIVKAIFGIRILFEPGFGATEPPPGTPDQAGLRINSFIEIRMLLDPGFGAKEPPPGTPDQAGLRIKSFIEIRMLLERGFGAKEPPPGTPDQVLVQRSQHCLFCRNGVIPTLGTSLYKYA